MPAQGADTLETRAIHLKGTIVTTTSISTSPRSFRARARWRVVDIVVASVVAVAVGLLYFVWDQFYVPVTAPIEAALPGLGALTYGVWLVGGVLPALIVRKPGAAIYGAILAALVEQLLGAKWGSLTLEGGFVQGLGAELVFLAFLYANWRMYVVVLAGAASGLAMAINDLVITYAALGTSFKIVYAICGVVSGAVIAGVGSWLLVRAIAKTGALARFASGRSA
jgi:energy-coupling factor transport system substrate-specific component